MDWIVTTARSVDEARTRALDLLGVDLDDAEIQVLEEGKTGLFGRTKTEARVRARIKPKAPPVKDERRSNRNDKGGNRNSNRNRGGRGGNNKSNGGNKGNGGGKNSGGNNKGNKSGGDGSKSSNANKGNSGGDKAAASSGGGSNGKGGNRNNNRSRNRGGGGNSGGGNSRNDRNSRSNEDRVEMPIDEQRETLEAFVSGVAKSFDPKATVTLVEEGTTLQAQVRGDDLGRLIGAKASTLQTLEELARTAMHRAAEGRRYHRIQVDVDEYRERRRAALARFATDLAEEVAASGKSKALEPMGAADRKLVHDAVGEVAGVETVSEGRDPRRYIVIVPTDGAGVDEEE